MLVNSATRCVAELLIVRKPESGGPDISVWPAQAEMPVPADTDNLTLIKLPRRICYQRRG